MQGRATTLLRAAFAVGAVTDALAVVPMVNPRMATAVWGFSGLSGPYYLAMGSAASLMIGWTSLLVWAWRRPVERRVVAPLTMLVVCGLATTEILGVRAGWVEATRVLPTLMLQAFLLALFGVAFRSSASRTAGEG